MLEYNLNDLVQALDGAKNINAALKKFLKNEVSTDQKSSRFVKDLRTICASKVPNIKTEFLGDKLPTFEPHLLGIIRYAYAEQTAAITSQITEKYADDFNTTYEEKEDGIVVKDPAKFNKIAKQVVAEIETGLKEKELPVSPLMKNVMLFHIFDPAVLKEVLQGL